jgi:crossover junction endodeoxyribonuclease RuvC
MNIIGIDPGTATTGYGIIGDDENGNIYAIDYGVITTSSELPVELRLKEVYHQVSELLERHHPHSGAVEKLYFKKNVKTAISVSQARGVILLAFANAGIKMNEYAPSEVKSAVTGYGSANKAQIQAMTKTLLRLEDIPKPDDAADALAIAICHLNSSGVNNLVKNMEDT